MESAGTKIGPVSIGLGREISAVSIDGHAKSQVGKKSEKTSTIRGRGVSLFSKRWTTQ